MKPHKCRSTDKKGVRSFETGIRENRARVVDYDIDPAELLEEHHNEARKQCSSVSSLCEEFVYTAVIPASVLPLLAQYFIFRTKAVVHEYHVTRGLEFRVAKRYQGFEDTAVVFLGSFWHACNGGFVSLGMEPSW